MPMQTLENTKQPKDKHDFLGWRLTQNKKNKTERHFQFKIQGDALKCCLVNSFSLAALFPETII